MIINGKVEELRALGWHVDLSEDGVSLHGYFKNGEPRKGATVGILKQDSRINVADTDADLEDDIELDEWGEELEAEQEQEEELDEDVEMHAESDAEDDADLVEPGDLSDLCVTLTISSEPDLEARRRPRRPWYVYGPDLATARTFGRLRKAVALFLEQAHRHAPQRQASGN